MNITDLLEGMRQAFGSDAELRIQACGQGSIETVDETIYFDNVWGLVDAIEQGCDEVTEEQDD
jgi:hypothetical protein